MDGKTELIVKSIGNVVIVIAVGAVLLIAGLNNVELLTKIAEPVGFVGFCALVGVNIIKPSKG